MDYSDLFPCDTCAHWLGLNPSCPECEEARRGGPAFQVKWNRMVAAKQTRIDRLRDLAHVPQIGLVGCGKAKRDGIYPVRELYIGSLFKLALAASETWLDESYVLSAKHGVLRLDDQVKSYDYSLYDLRLPERTRWGHGVCSHLRSLFPPTMRLRFIVLAGDGYLQPIVNAARAEMPDVWNFRAPMRGMDLFARMKWLATPSVLAETYDSASERRSP